jgi:hypothetical protein
MALKKLLHFVFSGFLVIGISSYVECQKNWIPGLIIKSNGDTLKGYINYRNWEGNPSRVGFRTSPEGATVKYSPMDIVSFIASDEVYVSAIVNAEMTRTNVNDLTMDKELNIEQDTAFLQTMIQGPKSLYYFMNRYGKAQFYIQNGANYELLVYKKYKDLVDGQTVVKENRKFIGQLILYLQDCSGIQSKLEKVVYEKSSLEEAFINYYKCIKSPIPFQKKTEKTTLAVGVLAGMSLTSLKFKDDLSQTPWLVNTDFNLSVNFAGGIFFDIIFPRNNKKWSVNNELTYCTYNVNSSYTEVINANRTEENNLTIAYSYIKMNNMLRFRIPIGDFSIFFNGGITNGIAVSSKNYRKSISTFYDQITTSEGMAVPLEKSWELGFMAGLGGKYKRFSLEVRYEWGNGISDYPGMHSTTNRIYFLLGFRIF